MWAQKPVGGQLGLPSGFDASWFTARERYYAAATSTSQVVKDSKFAQMFRSVGQLMHLVQDMSVPEHTRNDGHLLRAYEAFLLGKKAESILTQARNDAVLYLYDLNVLQRTPSEFAGRGATIHIANLFDTNTYNGSNPAETMQPNIGLAEYTNANFLSPDTNEFDGTPQKYPYPNLAGVTTTYKDVADPLNPGLFGKKYT